MLTRCHQDRGADTPGLQTWGGSAIRPQAALAFGDIPVRGMAFGMQSHPTATAGAGNVFLANDIQRLSPLRDYHEH